MIGVYLTIAILIITWIFWCVMDWYYKKHPMKLYNNVRDGRSSWDEILSGILRVVSIIGMTYTVVYLFITWK